MEELTYAETKKAERSIRLEQYLCELEALVRPYNILVKDIIKDEANIKLLCKGATKLTLSNIKYLINKIHTVEE